MKNNSKILKMLSSALLGMTIASCADNTTKIVDGEAHVVWRTLKEGEREAFREQRRKLCGRRKEFCEQVKVLCEQEKGLFFNCLEPLENVKIKEILLIPVPENPVEPNE